MKSRRSHVIDWADSGAIRPENLARAMAVAGVTPDAARWQRFVSALLLWLGALLFAAGVIFFFAYNWDALGRFSQFGVVEVLLAAAVGILLTGPIVSSAGPHAGARTIHGSEQPVKRLPIDLGWTARIHSTTVWIFLAVVVWVAAALTVLMLVIGPEVVAEDKPQAGKTSTAGATDVGRGPSVSTSKRVTSARSSAEASGRCAASVTSMVAMP